jgi:DNA-binding HxlR family transcriptional regulator
MEESALTGDAEIHKGRLTFERSSCPITNGLNVFGDKWTLLIIRDLTLGKSRYRELMSSPENIASNILSDRLKRLEAAGLVSRRAYQQKPVRYEYFLTEKGNDLKPILEAISRWVKKHYPGTAVFRSEEQRQGDCR